MWRVLVVDSAGIDYGDVLCKVKLQKIYAIQWVFVSFMARLSRICRVRWINYN